MACLRVVDVLKVATLGTYNIPDREDEGSEDSSRALFVDMVARKLEGIESKMRGLRRLNNGCKSSCSCKNSSHQL